MSRVYLCPQCGAELSGDALERCPNDGAAVFEPDPDDMCVGLLLSERYRLLGRIGEGGVGAVYRGVHIAMRKPVAVKVLHREYVDQPDFAARFRREARAASLLNYPHIVTVTDFGSSQGISYLVMELLAGESLARRLSDPAELPIGEALSILDQTLAALDHAHERGVIHRDLKSANVFLLQNPPKGKVYAKLLDFGFAKIIRTKPSEATLITQPGVVFGTAAYISPEQGTGGAVDGRTDIYAAGILAYELFCGERPFVAETPALTIMKHLHDAPRAPRALRPTLSAELEGVILKALEKKREQRFSSADEFRRALRETPEWRRAPSKVAPPPRGAGSGLSAPSVPPAQAPTAPAPEAPSAPPSGRPRALLALLVLVLVLGAGAAGFLLGRPKERAPTPQSAPASRPTERAEALLAEGKVDAAEAELRRLTSRDAYANLLLGNLAFSRSWWSDGLDAYARAIALDPKLRTHRGLLQNATQALRGKTRGRAEALLKDAGEAAYEPLVAATQGASREVREAAAALLLALGQEARVDPVDLALRALEEAEGCEARRTELLALAARNDPRATQALLRLHQSRPRVDPDACLRADLVAALKSLGVSEDVLGAP